MLFRAFVKKKLLVLGIGISLLSMTQDKPIRVACVGDSITYGSAIPDREINCYPAQLGRMLGNGYEVRNFGAGGRTLLKKGDCPYSAEQIYKDALDYHPDIVVIKLGTNDSKPWNWTYKNKFVKEYRAMIRAFRKLPSHPKVYLCLPVPVAGAGHWGITDSVVRTQVIPLIRQIAEKEKTGLIDLYKALDGRPELLPDLVHPNAEGAGIMARTVFEAITADKK